MNTGTRYTAVLVDTVSIQDYIFSSNKLLENIGASRLVDEIYEACLERALKEACPGWAGPLSDWSGNPGTLSCSPCGIGYIGGGNALVLFEQNAGNADIDKTFIGRFTRILLEDAPGLRTAFGVSRQFDLGAFTNSMKSLHQSLKRNKNRCFPAVTLPKHGITAECPLSGEALEPVACPEHGGRLVSRVSRARLDRGPAALVKIEDLSAPELKDRYTFTNETEKLGQVEHRDYLAVVHVDGNRMGEAFQSCADLPALRRLSAGVQKITEEAFRGMIADLVNAIDSKKLGPDNDFNFQKDGCLTILPVRPVVIGGDDITFVSDGRLGVWLAERFVKYFRQKSVENQQFTACAGVCIVKTRYPFYRAYEIAEQLCAAAKKKSRKVPGCYLDFLISSGGFSGTLEEVRERLCHSPAGRLNFGPYRLDTPASTDGIGHLKGGMKHFQDNNWSRTALARLREVLAAGDDAAGYLAEMRARNRSLYQISGYQYHETLRVNGLTPYYDMIELADFYPDELR